MIASSTYFDPLLADIIERPHGSIGSNMLVISLQYQQNMETSLSTDLSNLEVFSQIEVHKHGSYHRSSSKELANTVGRIEDNGFITVGQKENPIVIDN